MLLQVIFNIRSIQYFPSVIKKLLFFKCKRKDM